MSILRDLLDSSSLRRLNLIECMIQNKDWWKIEKIAEQLSCSESTVKSDINYFRLSFSNELSFETSKQNGVRLIVQDSFYMDSFYQQIMHQCLNVQFINLLFSESCHTLEEYADALYTSTSSVKRSIEQVRAVLKKYNLDIQQKPIRIRGSEKHILFFYGVLFWEEYGSSFLKLDYTYKKEAYELAKAFKEEMNLSLSVTLISKITLWFILYFERLSQGYHVEESYQTMIPISKHIKNFMIESTHHLPFEITIADVTMVSFFLESRYLNFKQEAIQTNLELSGVYNDIDIFLETLSKEASIFLVNKQELKNRLFSQYIYKLEFKSLNYSLAGGNKLSVLNNEGTYDCFLGTAQRLLHKSKDTKWGRVVLSDATDFFYILISTWGNLTSELLKKRRRINTLILSQFGLYHEKYLKEIIDIKIPYTFKSFLLTEENFSEDGIDLIITDHEVAEIKLQLDEDIPVIGVTYSPNNRNWSQLKDYTEMIFAQKRLDSGE